MRGVLRYWSRQYLGYAVLAGVVITKELLQTVTAPE